MKVLSVIAIIHKKFTLNNKINKIIISNISIEFSDKN